MSCKVRVFMCNNDWLAEWWHWLVDCPPAACARDCSRGEHASAKSRVLGFLEFGRVELKARKGMSSVVSLGFMDRNWYLL